MVLHCATICVYEKRKKHTGKLWLAYTPRAPQLAASQAGREARAHATHSLLYVLIFEPEINAQK